MESQKTGTARVVATALNFAAIFFSAIVGSVTTVVHQSSVTVGGIALPWGLVLSTLIVLAWFIGLHLLATPRWALIGSGTVFLVMVFVLSQRGPGGSVLVPESWQGNAWIMAAPLLVIVMMFWPRIRRTPKPAAPPVN